LIKRSLILLIVYTLLIEARTMRNLCLACDFFYISRNAPIYFRM